MSDAKLRMLVARLESLANMLPDGIQWTKREHAQADCDALLQAAELIKQLTAERDRLREALRKIEKAVDNHDEDSWHDIYKALEE